jgi:hypothetical protein
MDCRNGLSVTLMSHGSLGSAMTVSSLAQEMSNAARFRPLIAAACFTSVFSPHFIAATFTTIALSPVAVLANKEKSSTIGGTAKSPAEWICGPSCSHLNPSPAS